MIDEQNTTTDQEGTTDQNYIEALAKMRENSVPKEQYQKLVDENKQLVEAMINGETIKNSAPEPEVDIDKLRSELLTKDMTNMEYTKKSLELRNELLKRGEHDPFAPYRHNAEPEESDLVAASKAANALQHCLDVANGYPDVFNNELQRIMVDTVPITKRR